MFSPLAPSVCCIPFMFSHVLLPLVTSPGLLPPLSPRLFLVLSLVSVYLVCVFSFTPCPVIVLVCLWFLMLLFPVWCVLEFFAFFSMFDLNFDFDLNFVFLLCYFVSSLVATLSFVPVCLLFVFRNQLLNKARLLFVPLILPPVQLRLGPPPFP